MREGRALSPVEWLLAQEEIWAALWSRVRGPLRIDRLTQACATLATSVPMLTTRIADGSWLYATGKPLPIQVFPAGTELFNALSTALPRPGANPGAPLRVLVVPHGHEDSTVVLLFHHSIIDGSSAFAVEHLLWTLYGGGDAPRQAGLPPPLESFLAGRVTPEQVADHVAHRTALAQRAIVATLPARDSKAPLDYAARYLELGRTATEGLERTAAAAGLSTHAVVCGALLVAARRMMTGERSLTLTCHMPVNMRLHLRIAPQQPMFACSAAHLPAQVDDDPLAVARAISAGLFQARWQALECEVVGLLDLLAGPVLPITIGISNLGRKRLGELPGGLRCVDRHSATFIPGPVPVLHVMNRGGSLGAVIPYNRAFFTDQQMTALADNATALLRDLAVMGLADSGQRPAV
ncbi:hypothetical protein [Nonomuraea sp. NPDC049141]|uniref:phthiocerol/phthiodiolone dimycocerosyl transferase family protein n=1 Tax=Nonomuraea sp. NPDC049141 TaxID=3155500 RepID=UPI0033F3535D